TIFSRDWSPDVCSSDLGVKAPTLREGEPTVHGEVLGEGLVERRVRLDELHEVRQRDRYAGTRLQRLGESARVPGEGLDGTLRVQIGGASCRARVGSSER